MQMAYILSKYEKETIFLYNQNSDPILINIYDPTLRRQMAEYAVKYPSLCRRTDKQKYPDYAEYEIAKDRVSIRLIPPMTEEQKEAARERAAKSRLCNGMTTNGINTAKH